MSSDDQPGDTSDCRKHRWFTGISVIAASVAALAAVAIAIITYNSAQKELRAYVHVVPGNVHHVGDGSTLVGYVRIENSGQTYARDVIRHVGIDVAPPADLNDPTFFEERETLEEGKGVLSPGAPHSIYRTWTRAVTDTEKTQIVKRNGRDLRIYIFGTITYFDIFGNDRTTEFCFMYFGELFYFKEIDKPEGRPGYIGPQARFCEKHNKAT